MRILLATHAFSPQVGGLETVARVLADQFTAAGHQVTVTTRSAAGNSGITLDTEQFPYPVLRQPPARDLLAAVRACDVYFQHNISLQTLWPLALARRPWVVSFQTWLTRPDGSVGWQDRVKRAALRAGWPVAISRAMADSLPVPSALIGNPYDDRLFRRLPGVARAGDLVFLGRLVSDKGVPVLFDALAALGRDGLRPGLTVVGGGPEAANLRRKVDELGLERQVTFAGVQTGETLVRTLNAHRIMVIPSLWPEPFGVVALEGIACGCVPVGSEGGGLRDAIGPCGITFPNGDAGALADGLRRLLADEGLAGSLRAEADAHLARFRPEEIARRYLRVFEEALAA